MEGSMRLIAITEIFLIIFIASAKAIYDNGKNDWKVTTIFAFISALLATPAIIAYVFSPEPDMEDFKNRPTLKKAFYILIKKVDKDKDR